MSSMKYFYCMVSLLAQGLEADQSPQLDLGARNYLHWT